MSDENNGLPPSGNGDKAKPSGGEELEMVSPPFPLNEDTADKLHQRLLQLQEWFNRYRVPSNNYRGEKDCIPPARKVPNLEVHRKLSMFRLHVLVMQMRSLRRGWDMLVCLFEENWDGGKSQDERHALLHYGYLILDGAYLSDEMLEARNDTLQKQCMRTLARETGRFIMHMKMDPYHHPKGPEDDDSTEEDDDDNDDDEDPSHA